MATDVDSTTAAATAMVDDDLEHVVGMRMGMMPSLSKPRIDYDHIRYDQMNGKAFFFAVPLGSMAVRGLFYPINLIKTRMQVDSSPMSASPSPSSSTSPSSVKSTASSTYRSVPHAFRTIIREEGVRALYKGFGVNIVGVFGAPIYLTCFEYTRMQLLRQMDRYEEEARRISSTITTSSTTSSPTTHPLRPFASAIAGLCGSMVGQLFIVPLDVISQRIMVHRDAAPAAAGPGDPKIAGNSPTSARSILQHTLALHGWRGLYRGYTLAIMAAAPFSALTWGIYMPTLNLLRSAFGHQWTPEERATRGPWTGYARELVFMPTAAMFSCSIAVLATQPIDVVKTRLQVADEVATTGGSKSAPTSASSISTTKPKITARSVLRSLIATHGVGGLYIGLGPRLLSAAPAIAILVTLYESLKRVCVIDE